MPPEPNVGDREFAMWTPAAITAVFLASVVRLVRVCEMLENRRLHQQIDEIGIELGATLASNFQRGSFGATGTAVMTPIGNNIERVGNGRNARKQRNPCGGQPARIAGA